MLAFRENYLARDACKVVSLVVTGKAVRALLKSWITQSMLMITRKLMVVER